MHAAPGEAGRAEIVAFCDELMDISSFEDYGPNGLQVPGRAEVKRVATGVTPSLEFLEAAVETGADLALTHHQLLFGGLGAGIGDQLAARLRAVFAAGISVASYHLPLDAHPGIGNNALLREELGLDPDPRTFAIVKGRAIGCVGSAPSGLSEAALRDRVRDATAREPLVFACGPAEIRSVGVVTGAAAGAIGEAAALGLDALVTGEPAEHAMSDARELGLHFYAAGHYATETAGIRRLGEEVAARFGVEHEFIDIPNPV